MEKKEQPRNFAAIAGDMVLTLVAVAVVGITFFGVSGLTPRTPTQLAQNGQAVLGVTTKQQYVSYFPGNGGALPYIQSFTLTGNTSLAGDATISSTFAPLEASTYQFTLVTIKNSSTEYKRVQLTPSYSLDGAFTSFSMTFAGQEIEIISTDGLLNPQDLVLPPSSSSDVLLTVRPTTKIATPSTLTLTFTEVP